MTFNRERVFSLQDLAACGSRPFRVVNGVLQRQVRSYLPNLHLWTAQPTRKGGPGRLSHAKEEKTSVGERSGFREGNNAALPCLERYFILAQEEWVLQAFWLQSALARPSQGLPLLLIRLKAGLLLGQIAPDPLRGSPPTFRAAALPRYAVLFPSQHWPQPEIICSCV